MIDSQYDQPKKTTTNDENAQNVSEFLWIEILTQDPWLLSVKWFNVKVWKVSVFAHDFKDIAAGILGSLTVAKVRTRNVSRDSVAPLSWLEI